MSFFSPEDQPIANNRKFLHLFNSLSLLFLGGILFTFIHPFTEGFSFFFFTLMAVAGSYISLFYAWLYPTNKWLKVFAWTFLLNAAGLGWRVALEWGEVSLIAYLTLYRTGNYLFLTPLFITVVYIFINRFIHKRTLKE
ncbi:hypothetical protein [Jeotgalibacillus campisalis]|uniref:Uncharacterized protein n=1 Tax=Jeotgalibacillus campisalis TaxID=220754 RepID=A0A0C2VQD5_9BACL|nr:hypothetical protein [Jeotgalibacillus campisalis]KIL51112.1 hypothetical protein KR50_09930 [Jeotgalibacillus campisalis]